MLLDQMNYDNLFAGNFDIITQPVKIAAGQIIQRGDLLIKQVTETIAVENNLGTVTRTVAATYVKPTAEADANSFYAIAAEDLASSESVQTIVAYKTGQFNELRVGFGSATADGSRDILAAQGIYLTAANQ